MEKLYMYLEILGNKDPSDWGAHINHEVISWNNAVAVITLPRSLKEFNYEVK